MHTRIVSVCLLAIAIVLPIAALAAPMGSPTETPLPDVEKQPPTPTYGPCNAPQNADAFPSSPVAVVYGKCHNTKPM